MLIASNGGGSTTSSVVNISVQQTQAPPPPGSYGANVLSNNPVAFWQLSETNNPATGTVFAYDFTGNGHNGTYGMGAQNRFNNILGPTNFPGFAPDQGALQTTSGQLNSTVTIPALNLNTNAVTICMWIKPYANPGTFTGLLFERGGSETAGFGFGGTSSSSGMPGLGYTWNNNSGTTYNFSSRLYPQLSIWQFVVLVVQSNSATFYLYYQDPVSGASISCRPFKTSRSIIWHSTATAAEPFCSAAIAALPTAPSPA